MTTSSRSAPRRVVLAGPGTSRRLATGLLVVLVVAVVVGRESRPTGAQLALVWPAAGVTAIWMLAVAGRRGAWRTALAAGAATAVVLVATGATPGLAVGVATASVLQTAVLVAVYRRRPTEGPLLSLRAPADLWWFLAAAVSGCAAGAVLGAASAVLDGGSGPGRPSFDVVAGQWLVRHLVSVVVVGVLGLRLLDREVAWTRPPWVAGRLEQAAMSLALVGGYAVVLLWLPVLPLAFAVLPLNAWSALRRRTSLTAVHVLACASAVVAVTLAHRGPFVTLEPSLQAPTAQVFVLVVAVLSLLLAVHRDERDVLVDRARAATQAVERQSALLEAVVDSTAGGLSVFAADGSVVLRNAAAERFVGPWPAGGRTAWAQANRVSRADGSPFPFDELPVSRALRGERARETDVVLHPPGEPSRTVSIAAVPLPPGPAAWDGGVVAAYSDVTQARRGAVELAQARDHYRGVLDAATEQAITGTDAEGLLTVFNVGAERMLGYEAAEVLGRHASLLHDADEVAARARELGLPPGAPALVAVADRERHETRRWTYLRADGRRLQVMLTLTARRDAHGTITGYTGVATDVTEKVVAEQRLADSEELLRLAFETAPTAMLMVGVVGGHEGRVLRANRAASLLVGLPAEALPGRDVLRDVHPDDRQRCRRALEGLVEGRESTTSYEHRLLHADGSVRRGAATAAVIAPQADDPYLLLLVEDVTARRLAEERLSHLALHDALTGLPNRALLRDRLEHAVVAGRREGTRTGLLFVDLDGFKDVNDDHGHAAGDEVLRQVAERLRASARAADTVARLGGDEFAVVVPGTDAPGLRALADRLVLAVAEPVTLPDGVHVQVGASVGTRVAGGLADVDEMLQGADAAMYEAKRAGGGRVVGDGARGAGATPSGAGPVHGVPAPRDAQPRSRPSRRRADSRTRP